MVAPHRIDVHHHPIPAAEIAQGRVSGEHYTGRWVDVGTPQRLEELDNALRAMQNAKHD